jgi:hypothetical protein
VSLKPNVAYLVFAAVAALSSIIQLDNSPQILNPARVCRGWLFASTMS